MATKVFLDTNIIIDFLDQSRPQYAVSRKIVEECMFERINGGISETVVTNCSYILRKTFNQAQLREFFLDFSKFLTVLPFSNFVLKSACEMKSDDFEDAIMYQIALENDCQYFITSNLPDFQSIAQPSLPIVSPDTFLDWYKNKK